MYRDRWKNITEARVPLSDQGSIFQPAGPLAPHFSLAKRAKIYFSFAVGEENIVCKNIFLDLNLGQGRKNIRFLGQRCTDILPWQDVQNILFVGQR